MSPYTIFPTFNFLERVYKDGFRIIVYKVTKDIPSANTHYLFPYEAIFEEGSYVKIRTMQNPSNYVLYYDTKFLKDPSYVFKRIDTFKNNASLVSCRVYDFNIDDIKMELLKVNNFDIRQIDGTIDDLWIGVFFDRNGSSVKYNLCKKAPNGIVVRAEKSIETKIKDTKFMNETTTNKFAVKLEYVDAFECYKSKTDNIDFMDIKRGINRLPIKRSNTDWFCDDKTALGKLIQFGLPLEFAYNASTVDNMVFTIEDIYRSCNNNSVYGPIYKTFMD